MPVSVNSPVQARAKRTRQRLLQALGELLKEQEFELIAVSQIATKAGVAVGSVYSHFTNKEAFLEALIEERLARIQRRFAEVSKLDLDAEYKAAGDLRSALHALIKEAAQQVEEDAHIIRATYQYMRIRYKDAYPEWKDLSEKAIHTITPIITAYPDEVARKDIKNAGYILNYFMNVIFEKVIFPERNTPGIHEMDKDQFLREITDMAYGYLITPEAR